MYNRIIITILFIFSLFTASCQLVNFDEGAIYIPPVLTKATCPENFGARTNDGIDDSQAINVAIECLCSQGGGTVYFGDGDYQIDSTINVCSDIKLIGNGATVLSANVTTTDFVYSLITNSNVSIIGGYGANENITIRDMKIEGNSNPNLDGISFGHVTNITIENVDFEGFFWHAIDLAGCKEASIYDCTFKGGTMSQLQLDAAGTNSIANIFVDNTPTKDVNIFANTFEKTTGGGSGRLHLHRDNISDIRITENHFNTMTVGFYCDSNRPYQRVVFSSNTFENSSNGVVLNGILTDFVITDNIITATGQTISVGSASGVSNGVIIMENILRSTPVININTANSSILNNINY